jgi:hypothetical protein
MKSIWNSVSLCIDSLIYARIVVHSHIIRIRLQIYLDNIMSIIIIIRYLFSCVEGQHFVLLLMSSECLFTSGVGIGT